MCRSEFPVNQPPAFIQTRFDTTPSERHIGRSEGVVSDKQQFLNQLMNADNLNNILSAYWPKPVYGKKKGLDKAVYLL